MLITGKMRIQTPRSCLLYLWETTSTGMVCPRAGSKKPGKIFTKSWPQTIRGLSSWATMILEIQILKVFVHSSTRGWFAPALVADVEVHGRFPIKLRPMHAISSMSIKAVLVATQEQTFICQTSCTSTPFQIWILK